MNKFIDYLIYVALWAYIFCLINGWVGITPYVYGRWFFDKYLLIALQALWVYQQSEAVFLVMCDPSMNELWVT